MRKTILAALTATALALAGATTAQATPAHWYDKPADVHTASIRTKHFSVSRTVSGVAWVFACDGRWDYGGTGGNQFQMKSTTCHSTRNGASSTVKVDAVRWYYPNGQEIARYQFGGTVASCDDTSAAQSTHTEDSTITTVSGGSIQMRVWGLPGCGLAGLSDYNTVA